MVIKVLFLYLAMLINPHNGWTLQTAHNTVHNYTTHICHLSLVLFMEFVVSSFYCGNNIYKVIILITSLQEMIKLCPFSSNTLSLFNLQYGFFLHRVNLLQV